MDLELILAIVGVFIGLALTVNGVFLKGILQDLNAVKIELARLGVRWENIDKKLNDLEQNDKEIFERLQILEKECL